MPHSALSTQHSALIVIAGPTGVGKSNLAIRLAEALHGEIVNYDSIQIYRHFDIGSAKPSAADRDRVPHHLFDIVNADKEFNAADYARFAALTCEEIAGRGRRAVLVGGTFFYLRAFLAGLPRMPGRNEEIRERLRAIARARLHRWLSKVDPQSGRKIAPADRHRVERALEVWITSGRPISSWGHNVEEIPSIKIALTLERPSLVEALDRRVDAMYANGLVEETRQLLARYPREARPFGAIGYAEAVSVATGARTPEEAVAETRRRTRAYAKRQMTWMRAERNVHWLDAGDPENAFNAALRLIEVGI